ncbi:hypothetical protein L1887_18080 [Cichorium endivia]|nr:hypothetical protein L1887_18080 [Cichorium endivia]
MTRPYPPYNSYGRPSYNSYGHGAVLPIIQQLWVPGYGPTHHTTAMGQGNSPTRHTTATRGHASVLSPTTNNHRYRADHITVDPLTLLLENGGMHTIGYKPFATLYPLLPISQNLQSLGTEEPMQKPVDSTPENLQKHEP